MTLTITSVQDAPKRLDTSRPYQEGYSLRSGYFYEQDGLRFKRNGKQIGVHDPGPVTEVVHSPQYIKLRPEGMQGPVGLRAMDWRELKGLVESYGEDYTSKENAIQFLEGM